MKCWFDEKGARGSCAASGTALCYQHARVHDLMTITRSDTYL